MPKFKALIIGYGSIGRRHHEILKKIKKVDEIFIFTSQKNIKKSINKLSDIKIINPDFIIISSTTNTHYKYLNFINSNFTNKKILVEKPLFINLHKIDKIKNNIFVGYNLRLHPIIKFIKNWVKNKKILSADIYCGSYLPNWRNRPLHKTSSYDKKMNGGIIYELSHEIDYARFIFGPLKKLFVSKKKLSTIKMKDNDYSQIIFKTKKESIINIKLNYYSYIRKRFIIIDTSNQSLFANLITGEIVIQSKTKKKIKKFKYNINNTYKEQMTLLIKEKFKSLCSYNEGYETLKTIKNLNI